MIFKMVWIGFVSLVLLGLVLFGGLGVSVTPVMVEKEISESQLPQ